MAAVTISHASKVMLQILQARLQQYMNCEHLEVHSSCILQARLQQYMNCELPDVQAGFRKSRGTRDQIAMPIWCKNSQGQQVMVEQSKKLVSHSVSLESGLGRMKARSGAQV